MAKTSERNIVQKLGHSIEKFMGASDPKIGYIWKPKEDITAYELARCVPAFGDPMMRGNLESFIDNLPEECQRHFKKVEEKEENL